MKLIFSRAHVGQAAEIFAEKLFIDITACAHLYATDAVVYTAFSVNDFSPIWSIAVTKIRLY